MNIDITEIVLLREIAKQQDCLFFVFNDEKEFIKNKIDFRFRGIGVSIESFLFLNSSIKVISLVIQRVYEMKNFSFLKELKNLASLNLRNNNLTDVTFLKELKNLTSLSLVGNHLTDVTFLKELKNLTSLDLSWNKLTDVTFVKELKNLTSLDLTSNNLTDVTFLKELKNLTSLDLTSNNLTDVTFLKELKNLTSLDLTSNNLTDVTFLKELKNLTSLDLTSNNLTDVTFVKELKNLTSLDLSGNDNLTDVTFLKELKNLTSLSLSSNNLTDVTFLKELKNLTSLSLRRNNLTDVTFLKELTKLTSLSLSYNNLTDVTFLKELAKLTSLDLSYNNLTDVTFLKELKNLTSLDLSDNNLTDVTFLKELKNLTTLYLSDNNLTDVTFLKELKNLTSLYLRGNNLTDVTFLKEFKNLTSLDLSWNKNLTDVTFLKELKNLTSLYLMNNNLTDVTFLKELKNLTSLYLMNNNLTDVTFLKELKNLTSLYLGKNPITNPPKEIVEQGIEGIRNYFKELEDAESEEYLYEAKLVLVGRGETGKTVLTKRLTIPGFYFKEKETTTPGIDVLKNPFKLQIKKLQNAAEYRFNIWDFGGQEKYDATHQFFITERSVYLFLTDARKEDNYLDFDYWLNTIKLLGGLSPVIVVITKIDERKKNYPQYQYKEQYKNIIAFVEVSCAESYDHTIETLKEKISEAALLLPQTNDKLPGIWVEIRKDLEKLSEIKDFISYKEYQNICDKYKMNEKRALFLSSFLNDLGVIIHHQKDILLKRTVIINTDWGIDGVYKVLDDDLVIESNGFFTKNNLKIIWNDDKYINCQAELLQLMLNFKLCFECKDGEGYIAPTLLSYDKPEDLKWNEKDNIKLEYDYIFMPAGLVARFIVEVHEYIANKNFWKYGVKINYDKTNALIEEDYIHRKIIVKVEGENKKGTLTFIMMKFKEIHKAFEKLEYQEMVSCTCEECKNSAEPTLFDYEELRQYEREGEEFIKCKKGKLKNVEVRGLINDVFEEKKLSEINEIKRMHIENINVYGQANLADEMHRIQTGDSIVKINKMEITGRQVNIADKIENIYYNANEEIKEKLDELRKWAGGERVTLAIVFTDIVNSALLGEKLGDAKMNKIRKQHFERGEKILKEHEGFLIKTIGDSLMVAFRNVENVLDFTLAFRNDTGNELIKIRQGAHIGITSIDNDDVFGSHVNRAARIAHLANADEIVVSEEFKKDVDTLRHPKYKNLQWELIPNVSLKGFEGTFNLWKVKNII